jgi:glycosyltransferase involved in cell wall biosynthesis
MIPKKNILVIGRDSSAAVPDSQLYRRIKIYAQYHNFTFVVMNKGVTQVSTVDGANVILAGGSLMPIAFIKAFWTGYTELKQGKYDLVTTQDALYAGIVGWALSRLFKLPLFLQMHGDYLDNERWFSSKVGSFNRVMNYVGIFVLKRADYVRAVSNRLRTQLIENYQLNPERVISIPIGTNLDLFKQSNAVTRSRVLLFAQRLLPEKCPMLFAEVVTTIMKQYSDVSVAIAGDGSLKETLVDYFTREGVLDRAVFHGAVAQETLVKLYQQSYAYIHTADWEGWGMPMIEAMAAGCPVVTTDTGCAGEAVRHNETGLVTAVNDREALTYEINRLLTDTELWNTLSTQGIKESVEWSFATLARKNMEWYAIETKH